MPGDGDRRNRERWTARIVRSLDHDRLQHLIQESRAEGFAFVARLTSDWRSGENRFDRRGEALFVVDEGGEVVAICGLNIDPFHDDPRVARLRHLYVARAARRRGLGRFLVGRALEHATANAFTRVRLRTDTSEAATFYERLGFGRCRNTTTATHERWL